MNTQLKSNPYLASQKYNYDVLIEQTLDGEVTASVLGWQNCQVKAATKEEALNKLHQLLTQSLQNKEIVSLEIKLPANQHPWLKFAGMYQNNPLFSEVLTDIENNRQSIHEENE